MPDFAATLRDSFGVFAAHPKLIVPKLIIAVLYSYLLLVTADLSLQAVQSPSAGLLVPLLLTLVAVLLVNFVDIGASAMYSFLVEDARKKRGVSLLRSLKACFPKAWAIVPSVVLVELAFIALTFILSVPASLLFVSESDYFIAYSIAYGLLLLAVVFFFYLLYPVLVFEKVSALGALKRSFSLSLENCAGVSKATLLSFFLSVASFAVAFLIELFPQGEGTIVFWVVFILVRLLTAYVYAYLYILNPVFYFNYVKGVVGK
ncbi:MAG: hypothetical protein AABW99_04380 [archaeon]